MMLLLVAQKVHLLGPSRSALARSGILTSLNNTRDEISLCQNDMQQK
jgi:hypothetical protein